MIFVLAPSTIFNRWTLKARRLPRLMLAEAQRPLPRRLMLSSAFWRMAAESPMLRNAAVIAPIPAAVLVAPDLVTASLGLSPALLFLMLFAEGNLVPVRARKGEAEEAERVLDLLRTRGRAVLTRIAASRGVAKGKLTLVVEQSSLARLPPITLVSVHSASDNAVIDLSRDEQRMLREGLFAEGLDEAMLLRVNLVQKTPVREVSLEAGSISAHARLAGMARRVKEPA
ncbi:hypothetical protein LAZ40_24585 [Cereibacter sphaeroides]|uniref:hypothetical protein n=1 Tax=Rhodobacterales TaxID=204455 RepID=UPI000BBF242A|nr:MULTISPECIES: hypothetical protein [Paracoccaceae]MCE6952688.1 hypothetical protein [Cereibacter sphaeroides]MCE6962215.1 hypothetical protein [Cereibacter sphaeroides]MCE6970991.1 hypothetical protein [Cereibacter sphaeroides]MCE6972415.1 hypothetical protein [Cereibacter sphaeroides]